jgi:hypothetical protein
MGVRWGRLLLGTAVAELVPVATLILMVAAMGPRDPEEAEVFTNALGRWIGPLVGAAMAFAAARWVTRPLHRGHAVHGFLLGFLLALLDILNLMTSGAAFAWIFVASNLGKIAAGTLGGMVTARRSVVNTPRHGAYH